MDKKRFNLTEKELKEFFDKYDGEELGAFNKMFKFVYEYEMADATKACNEGREVSNSGKIIELRNKNKSLTDRELDFLHELTDTVLMTLDEITKMDVERKTFEVSVLQESVQYELGKRQQVKFQKTIGTKPQKNVS